MAKAEALVRGYVEAGFVKLHLDASMACAGDPDPLPPELIAAVPPGCAARRGRRACQPVYVIGTEVPVPAARTRPSTGSRSPAPRTSRRTIEVHQVAAFADGRPGAAWPRVLAVVVQPGVEFGSAQVVDFVPERARAGRRSSRAWRGWRSRRTPPTTRPRRRCARWSRTISRSSRSARAHLRPARGPVRARRDRGRAGLPPSGPLGLREALDAAMLADPRTGGATTATAERAAVRPRLQPQRPLPLLLAGPAGGGGGRAAARQPRGPARRRCRCSASTCGGGGGGGGRRPGRGEGGASPWPRLARAIMA